MGQIRIGMSGWTYAPWRGSFYPRTCSQKRELEYASRQVNSIEVNGTFYSLQRPSSFQRWAEETPEGFQFSVKGGRYVTHIRRLKGVDDAIANFFASGILCLGSKLGPILWQFPPNVMWKDERFAEFLKLLPRTSKEAARLARKHTAKMEGRAWTRSLGDYPIRHAFEFRHPSFAVEGFLDLLRKHNAAFVFAHDGKKSPYLEDLTADFVYARMHGQSQGKNGYSSAFLKKWAGRVDLWAKGKEPPDAQRVSEVKAPRRSRDVYVYFDNELKARAPFHALTLAEQLGWVPLAKVGG